MLSEALRKQRATLGAYSLHAQGKTNTGPARARFLDRFLDAQPTDLPGPERERRAAAARSAYFARLTFLSLKARTAHKNGTAPVTQGTEAIKEEPHGTSMQPSATV